LVINDIQEKVRSMNKAQIKECLREFFWKKDLTPVVKDAGGYFFINNFFKKEGF